VGADLFFFAHGETISNHHPRAAQPVRTDQGPRLFRANARWAFQNGRRPSEEEIEVWNGFMSKRGWRDGGTQRLHERLAEIGLPAGTVETMFEFIDLDEGRTSPKAK
jgi:hypothetical protein